jgi:hypothetical protein
MEHRILVAHGLRPNKALAASELQRELMGILTRDQSDEGLVQDFFWMAKLYVWPGDDEADELNDPSELSPEQRDQLLTWLRSGGVERLIEREPLEVPAAWYFERPRPLPPGTWLLHHTDETFCNFDRGATVEGLQLSTWSTRKSMAQRIRRKDDFAGNVDDSLGSYERVYAFAFTLDDDPAILRDGSFGSSQYGRRAVLFKSDAAVRAWHTGDLQQQAIFPVGTEYSVWMLGNLHGAWQVDTDDGLFEYDTIDELIEAIESGKLFASC